MFLESKMRIVFLVFCFWDRTVRCHHQSETIKRLSNNNVASFELENPHRKSAWVMNNSWVLSYRFLSQIGSALLVCTFSRLSFPIFTLNVQNVPCDRVIWFNKVNFLSPLIITEIICLHLTLVRFIALPFYPSLNYMLSSFNSVLHCLNKHLALSLFYK